MCRYHRILPGNNQSFSNLNLTFYWEILIVDIYRTKKTITAFTFKNGKFS